MNKLLFDLNGNVVPGPYTVTGNYQYENDFEGKKSVLSFTRKGDSLKIRESQIGFDGESDYLEFNFRVDNPPETETETKIVSGHAIPFTLSYFVSRRGLVLHTQLITTVNETDYNRESESNIPLEYATWYNVKIIFIHGEYSILLDDQPHLRRIYKGTWKDYAKQNLVFGGGAQNGLHLCDIAMSQDIFEEANAAAISEMLQLMDDGDFMEDDSCIQDCELDGIILQKPSTKQVIDGKFCRVYGNGAIVFDYEDKAMYLSKAVFNYYSEHFEETGRPVAYMHYTCQDDQNEIEYGLFEQKGVFHNATKKITKALGGDILKRFLDCDLALNRYWYPTFSFTYEEPVPTDGVVFSNGLVIYAYDGQTFLISSSLHDFLAQGDNLAEKTGLPISDYQVGVDAKGNKCYETLECQNGTIHSTDTFKNFFTEIRLGAARKLGGTKLDSDERVIHYYDFEHGVIVLYPGQTEPVVHGDLRLRLLQVTAGNINDFFNKTPEMYLKLTLYQDDKKIVSKKRYGSKSYPGSTQYTWASEDSDYVISPLQSSSSFRIRIQLYDLDPVSRNDFLGSFSYNLSIENGWGCDVVNWDGNDMDNGQFGLNTLPMTKEGKDNQRGLDNNELRISVSDKPNYAELMGDIMKNFTFPFENFKGSYPFNSKRFSEVFSNVNHLESWYDYLLHPVDKYFYNMCRDNLSGAKCYGFAAAEMLTMHNLGPFTPPLFDRYPRPEDYQRRYENLNENLAGYICDYYLYQVGWDAIMWEWKKLEADNSFRTRKEIQSIIDILDHEKCCLLCMLPEDLNGGHAVMAYGYKKIKPEDRDKDGNYYFIQSGGKEEDKRVAIKADYDYLIYIADCNFPKREKKTTISSFISFEKVNGKEDRIIVYHTQEGMIVSPDCYKAKNYVYLYGTPLSIISRPPRVPNFLDLTDALGTLVCAWFSCAVDDVQISDPDTDEVLYDQEKGILKTDRLLVVRNKAAGGADGPTLFVLKGNNLNVKFRGAKKDELELRIAGREASASFKTRLSKGEELGFSFRNVHRPDRFTAAIRPSVANKTIQTEISFVDKRDKSTRNVFTKEFVVNKEGAKLSSFNATARMKMADSVVLPVKEKVEVPVSDIQRIEMKRDHPGAIILNRNLTTAQISKLYHIKPSTARKYCRQGLIPKAMKASARWRIPSENNTMQ